MLRLSHALAVFPVAIRIIIPICAGLEGRWVLFQLQLKFDYLIPAGCQISEQQECLEQGIFGGMNNGEGEATLFEL